MKNLNLYACVLALVAAAVLFAGCSSDDDEGSGDDTTPHGVDDDTTIDDTSDDLFSPRVGFAKVDITPSVAVKMAGFGMALFSDNNIRRSTGVPVPLFAPFWSVSVGAGLMMVGPV